MRSFRLALLLLAALAAPLLSTPRLASAQVIVSVRIAPPLLPVYVQPAIPGPGYIWAPGYWAWGPFGYYWVPGTWVLPPRIGVLWTPGYWGWGNGVYLWHTGYWGRRVGFYGGVNYGFGYTGVGYVGGYWNSGRFFYNRSVNNVTNVNITNVYNRPVTTTVASRTSFNGPGGVQARPTATQLAAAQAPHIRPTQAQLQHRQLAVADPQLRATVNKGAPPIAATARPAALHGAGVVAAHNAPLPSQPATNPAAVAHAVVHRPPVRRTTQPTLSATHPQAVRRAPPHPQAVRRAPPRPQAVRRAPPRPQAVRRAPPHPQAVHRAPPRRKEEQQR
jgi:WXXGXW repeat (2 copies)